MLLNINLFPLVFIDDKVSPSRASSLLGILESKIGFEFVYEGE